MKKVILLVLLAAVFWIVAVAFPVAVLPSKTQLIECAYAQLMSTGSEQAEADNLHLQNSQRMKVAVILLNSEEAIMVAMTENSTELNVAVMAEKTVDMQVAKSDISSGAVLIPAMVKNIGIKLVAEESSASILWLVSGSERAQAAKTMVAVILLEANMKTQETTNHRANFRHDQEKMTPILALMTDIGVEEVAAETTIKKKAMSAPPPALAGSTLAYSAFY